MTIRGNCSFCDPIEPATTTDGSGSAQTSNKITFEKRKPNKEYRLKTIVVENDVDVVFVNVKREFRFWTEKELRADFGSHQNLAEMKIGSFEFAYDAVPGVYYHMRKVILSQ
ncbi:MAG: hypothetical protein GY928_00895 [Colwellia sp.]|nr:hypothetical protein [Colwellia sp.]